MKREDKVAKQSLAWTVLGAALLASACGSGSTNPIDAAGLPDATPADAGRPDAEPGSPPLAEVLATAVDFGAADCGGAAATDQVVRLTNGGGTTLTWSATMRFTPAFRVTGTNGGQLAPGDSVDITIAANPVAASATAGQVLSDVLLITHNDTSRGPIELPVTLTAQGGTLTLSPTAADFGLIPVGATAPAIPLTITNTGNAPVDVALASPDVGGLGTSFAGGPAAVTLAPGASLTDALATFTPTSTAASSATAALAVTGAVCGASATSVALRGQGTAAQALVSPATVDFGQVSCGVTAQPHVFFVANTGNQAFSWSAALDAGDLSRYTIVPTSGIVGPGSSQTVTVFSEGIPAVSEVTPNAYGETVTVTTSAPGDSPRTINLAQTARGAIIALDNNAITMDTPFEFAESSPASTGTVTIRNDGNLLTTVSLGSSGGAFALDGVTSIDLAPGASVDAPITFNPLKAGITRETLTLDVTSVTCAPLPTGELTGEARLAQPGKGAAVEALFANDIFSRSNQATMCARTASGHVVCFGGNVGNQRGTGGPGYGQLEPNVVQTSTGALTDVTGLSSGRDWFCAQRTDGSQWCWGNTPDAVVSSHQNARGGGQTLAVATQRFTDVSGITGSGPMGCGVTSAASLTCFANGNNGVADAASYSTADVVAAAAHSRGVYALKTDGTVWSFGSNQRGERGDPTVADGSPGAAIPTLSDVVEVVAGSGGRNRSGTKHGCARKTDGTVWCWGRGQRGRLGDGTSADRTAPVQVMLDGSTPLTGATAISAGREFSCAATPTNVYCWGRGSEGQVGTGSSGEAPYATPVSPAVTDVATLRSANRQTCATLTSGAVRCWGQLGWGTFYSPTAIDAFEPLTTP